MNKISDDVRYSTERLIWVTVEDSVWDSVRTSVVSSVWGSMWDSMWDSANDAVGGSIRDYFRTKRTPLY